MKFTTLTAAVGSASALHMSSKSVSDINEVPQVLAQNEAEQIVEFAETTTQQTFQDRTWRKNFHQEYMKFRNNAPSTDDSDNQSDDDNLVDYNQKPTSHYSNETNCDGSIERLKDEDNIRFTHGNTPFVDKSFDGDYSLFTNWSGSSKQSYLSNHPAGKYRRPSEMSNGKPLLWGSKGVSEHAIKQGGIGDCWLVASISALGEYPERAKKVVGGIEDYPVDGMFKFNLWTAGRKWNVTIDDQLAVNNHNQPYHAQMSRNGAWWGPLFEKAAAKLWGRYEKLNAGQSLEALYILTGQPVIQYTTNDATWTYDKIKWADEKKYIMAATCNKNNNNHYLVPGHVYTILGAYTVADTRLILARNPWAGGEYKGPWSDSSAEFNKYREQIKQITGHEAGDDGSFLIPIKDYVEGFSFLDIQFYQDWVENRQQIQIPKQTRNYNPMITNPITQTVMVGAVGYNNRFFKSEKDCSKTQYQWSHFFAYFGGKKITANRNAKQGWQHYENLPAGTYKFQMSLYNPLRNYQLEGAIETFGEKQALTFV